MKRRIIAPLALAATMLFGFGCASTNDTMSDTTAMEGDVTMTETQEMAGTDTDLDEDVDVDADVDADIDTDMDTDADMSASISMDALSMENPVSVDEMFADIDDTEQYDVLELARMNPNLSTFVSLVEQSGLESDLSRLGKFTLLAPTNEAFSKVDHDKLETLLNADNKAVLKSVLQAHVLPNEVTSAQFQNNSQIQVGENSYIPVEVGVNNTNIRIGGAQVVKANVEASNGVIHVIDNVILPENAQNNSTIGY